MTHTVQVRRLHMYKQRPVRDKKGKVLFEAYQSKAAPSTRIIPDRRWFGNTRVIGARRDDSGLLCDSLNVLHSCSRDAMRQ